jgi:hypothetical protein
MDKDEQAVQDDTARREQFDCLFGSTDNLAMSMTSSNGILEWYKKLLRPQKL